MGFEQAKIVTYIFQIMKYKKNLKGREWRNRTKSVPVENVVEGEPGEGEFLDGLLLMKVITMSFLLIYYK